MISKGNKTMANNIIGIKELLDASVPLRYRKYKFKTFKHKFVYYLRYLANKKHLQALIDSLNNEAVRLVLEKEPFTIFKPTRPYFMKNLDVQGRCKSLTEHFEYFSNHHTQLLPLIYSDKGTKLGNFAAESPFFFVLREDSVLRKECELTITITDGGDKVVILERTKNNTEVIDKYDRFYTIGFNINKYKNSNEYAIFISNIQGPDPLLGDMKQIAKDITKQAFGIQPRFLLISAVLMFAKAMNINHVCAVKANSHVFTHPHYKKIGDQIHVDYDELWNNFNPIPYDDNFVEITEETRKAIEDISSNKRSMYRKRYAWCDDLETQFAQSIKDICSK